MVDFISWLVNVYGAGVASYTHALSEWFWTHWGLGFNMLQSHEGKKTTLLFGESISTLTIGLISKSILPSVYKD